MLSSKYSIKTGFQKSWDDKTRITNKMWSSKQNKPNIFHGGFICICEKSFFFFIDSVSYVKVAENVAECLTNT